jgi:penicillin-binding protein 2
MLVLGALASLGCAKAAPAPAAPPRPDSPYVAALRAKLGELTLVPALQAAAEEALGAFGKPGALVALDPNDGRVLAVYSVPGDRGDPLLVPQRPASTFKSFAALAGLRAGVIRPDTVFTCTGGYDFGQVRLTCPQQHGAENVQRALAASCNAFFYQVGDKTDPAQLADVARSFGLGASTGSELGDPPGVIPEPPAKGAQRTAQPLVDAIGHGGYRVTLLGLARGYAAIANGGMLVELHVAAHGTRPPAAPKQLDVDPAALALVRSGLFDAVAADYGRAHEVAIPGLAFAGKTGGDDSPPLGHPDDEGSGDEVDSWFVAYAPPEHPKLLVAARLERMPKGAPSGAMHVVARFLALERPAAPPAAPQARAATAR